MSFPKRTTIVVTSDKYDNWTTAEQLGLSEEAQLSFRHALSALEVTLEVNQDGTYKIIEVTDYDQILKPIVKSKCSKFDCERDSDYHLCRECAKGVFLNDRNGL